MMNKREPKKIVDISGWVLTQIGPSTEFAVLYNPTVKEINALAKLRPEMFILPFITDPKHPWLSGNDPPDMTKITKSHYIIAPYWIVHHDKRTQRSIVTQIINQFMDMVNLKTLGCDLNTKPYVHQRNEVYWPGVKG